MKVDKFKCPVCDTVGKWKNVDQFRMKEEGTHICENCGFVTYPKRFKSEEQIRKFYRDEYRSAPTSGNIKSGERKLQYHEFFLRPLLQQWKEKGNAEPVVGEIGSALGMFLDWIRRKVPGAKIHGCELTTGFRRVAYWEFGIRLEEDFDFSKKYDLITSFHVLEHQMEPDVKLKQYADCLKDDGYFYLSVPVWFGSLHCDAVAGFDLEYYWHPDHFNSWSEEHLEWIFAKAGLEVAYKNTEIYGYTYMLKKTNKVKEEPKWSFDKCIQFMDSAKRIWVFLQEHKTSEALALYKNCITSWIHHYEMNRKEFHKNQDSIWKYLEDAIAACPNSADAYIFAADVSARYERHTEALKYYTLALNKKPNNPTVILGISNCYRQMAAREKNPAMRTKFIELSLDANRFVRQTSLDMQDKAISWSFHDMSLLEVPPISKEEINEKVIPNLPIGSIQHSPGERQADH